MPDRATEHRPFGNILGNPRAEADAQMLGRAFVKTADFSALANTNDFHVVVGRRGTGKSALFHALQDVLERADRTCLHAEVPIEHFAISAQSQLAAVSHDYKSARAIARLLWRAYVLRVVGESLRDHYRVKSLGPHLALTKALTQKRPDGGAYAFFSDSIRACKEKEMAEVPREVATRLEIDSLQSAVADALREAKSKAVVMFDGLDEGWVPEVLPTAILGALAFAAADLSDANTGIHVIAFVRDNMFRALAKLDPDFSSHVEGSALRLHWDKNALFHLVAERLRVALNLNVENDTKVWDRFAQRELQGRAGFERCLHHTLYRPRDTLVLLNRTYQYAQKDSRTEIIGDDLDASARAISEDRLEDLFKEYKIVLPGLHLFVDIFRGAPARSTYEKIVSRLEDALRGESFSVAESRDFAILGSGREIFRALYSVGFLGIQSVPGGSYSFCHDGALSELTFVQPGTLVAIHPCFWRALDIVPEDEAVEVLTEAFDETLGQGAIDVGDIRTKRLGRVVEGLRDIQTGLDGARQFEDWVLSAVQILFSGDLVNIEFHPNPAGLQRRDVVATINAAGGFWKRVLDDYGSRQVLFEAKNYAELKPDDYRQVLDYSGGPYGKFVVIVYRTENEGADENERQRLKEMYLKHGVLIFLLPATVVSRCISKLRSKQRDEYWQKLLAKRLDTHERTYVQIEAARKKTRQSRSKRSDG
jgi:hypothetical protein